MDKLMKVKEAADMLGVASITLRQWIQHDKIDSVKVNGTRRIKESVVKEMMNGKED